MATSGIAARRRRVVIVEDNHAAADSMQQLLTHSGYDVRVAYNGTDGVQVAEEWPPDFVLCDIGLPGLDGYGVAQALVGTRRLPEPISWLSLLTGPTNAGRGREAGFERHFTKPVDPDVILGLLASP